MIATPSAADGATAILLVLGGIGYTSAMPEYDDDRHRRRAAAESEGEGGGSFGRPALNLYAPSDGLPLLFPGASRRVATSHRGRGGGGH